MSFFEIDLRFLISQDESTSLVVVIRQQCCLD